MRGFQREVQRYEAYETDRLSRITLENLMASEVFVLDRIASPAGKLKALNSAGVALRAGTQGRLTHEAHRISNRFNHQVDQLGGGIDDRDDLVERARERRLVCTAIDNRPNVATARLRPVGFAMDPLAAIGASLQPRPLGEFLVQHCLCELLRELRNAKLHFFPVHLQCFAQRTEARAGLLFDQLEQGIDFEWRRIKGRRLFQDRADL